MPLENITQQYQQLLSKYEEQKLKLETKIRAISMVRLAIFILLLFVIYKSFVTHQIFYWWLSAISLIVFLVLVKAHAKLFNKKTFINNLLKINKDEISSLKGDYSAFGDGKEYEIMGHDFSLDLDVFGKNSLFQFTDRTSTYKGSQLLANWFNNPSINTEEILQRQQSAAELSKLINFRQHFKARGMSVKETAKQISFLEKWYKVPNLFFSKIVFKILLIIIPIINVSSIILFSMDVLNGKILSLLLLMSLGIVGIYTKKINTIHINLSKRTTLLEKYITILKLIESQDFKSTLLKNISKTIETNKETASESISKLSKILAAFDTRLNIFAGILLNAILLWDIQQVWKMEKWKSIHAKELSHWFEAIAKIDALNSIANIKYNNPQWIFPEINNSNKWIFEAMRHPLMKTDDCIPNNFVVEHIPHLNVITGANMAGKSTYLRTIGSNMILAMIGAAVNAEKMNFQPIQIISSLRTTDSLIKNESYFYAEIKRLQLIVDRLRNGERLFVLLDEILKGTNSKDKEQGSKALLRQLLKLNAIGIIATHDLSLGKLEEEFYPNIENYCFEVDIKNDELSFDYKIRPGIAKNMNASFLLKKMGIV